MDCSIYRSRLGPCKRNRTPIYVDFEDRVDLSNQTGQRRLGLTGRAIDHIAETTSQIEFDLDEGYFVKSLCLNLLCNIIV